jgi:thymidylate synthase
MRANDAYRGTASDVFSFTFLQELLAHQLGLELGSYTHVAGSYHLYQADDALADRVLADASQTEETEPFPVMPAGDNWDAVHQVVDLEQAMRTGRLVLGPRDIEQLGLAHYWAQIVALFSLHARRKLDDTIDPDLMGFLDPVYLRLVKNSWQDRYAEVG